MDGWRISVVVNSTAGSAGAVRVLREALGIHLSHVVVRVSGVVQAGGGWSWHQEHRLHRLARSDRLGVVQESRVHFAAVGDVVVG